MNFNIISKLINLANTNVIYNIRYTNIINKNREVIN